MLWVNKSFLEQFSTPHTTLTHCFDSTVPGHTNLLRLAPTPRQHVTDLMERLVAETNSADYGSDLASIGCLIQLLVELNRQAANSAQHHELTDKSGPIVTNVLNYINDHYHEELSLDMLASRFFVNKYHLSHEFNRLVGTSIYRYVIQKRLVIAKQMLSDGLPPTDVYQHCGFGDYSIFTALSRPNTASAPKISPARLKRTAQAPNKRGAGAPASGTKRALDGRRAHSRSWPSVSRRSSPAAFRAAGGARFVHPPARAHLLCAQHQRHTVVHRGHAGIGLRRQDAVPRLSPEHAVQRRHIQLRPGGHTEKISAFIRVPFIKAGGRHHTPPGGHAVTKHGPFLGRLGPGVDDIPSPLHTGKAPTHHRGNDLPLPQNKHRRAVRGEHLIPRRLRTRLPHRLPDACQHPALLPGKLIPSAHGIRPFLSRRASSSR